MMKLRPLSITIDLFRWDVTYLFATKRTTLKEFDAFLSKHRVTGAHKQSSLEIFTQKTAGNAGEHYYDLSAKCSTVIIYPCTSHTDRIALLAHENRHVADRLCQTLGISDIETPAYIEGYLMGKVLNYLKANKL